jgi:SAM-dependent methyltransferase
MTPRPPRLSRLRPPAWLVPPPTLAQQVTARDVHEALRSPGRRFAAGARPVIRWIKGDGCDDAVTRAAIGQATRLFGQAVDYCLCTRGLDAARVRSVLAWAAQPVEWWPVSEADNPALAGQLLRAGCAPERFGYWWKWFPERVRPSAPEWILDGDMVVTQAPPWFDAWVRGADRVRVAQDDAWPPDDMYGRYVDDVDQHLKLYSGLVSLPPGVRYMDAICEVLDRRPLVAPHDGTRDKCEQGVVAAAFQALGAAPIPLCEFPFARGFAPALDFGAAGDRDRAWGYHFGNAFRAPNPHFARLTAAGVVFSRPEPDVVERFSWLGGFGQWGVPGWAMPDGCARELAGRAVAFAGRRVLELGTSRGRFTAILATLGCQVTTVDRHDRGAAVNLAGLGVRLVRADAVDFLQRTGETFDLIVVDLHGNDATDWERRAPGLRRCLAHRGTLFLDNARLHEIPEWHDEVGVARFLAELPPGWRVTLVTHTPPGVAIVDAP